MAGPITWRNVDAPDLRGASSLFHGAQTSLNTGFDRLGQVIQQREAGIAAQEGREKDDNTQAFLDSLTQAKTPEEFLAQRDALAAQRQGYGRKIDRAAARAAEESRLPTLQQRATTDIAYNNTVTDANEAPIRDQAALLIAQGRGAEAQPLIEKLTRNKAPLAVAENVETARRVDVLNKAAAEARAVEDQGFQRDRAGEAALLAPITRQTARAQADHYAALSEAQRRSAASEGKTGSKEATAALEAFIKNSSLSAGTIDTKEGMAAVTDWIHKNVKGDAQREDLLYNVGKRAAEGVIVGKDEKGNPIKAPIPAMTMIKAIMGATENPAAMLVPGWSRRGDDADNNLLQLMKDPALLREIATIHEAQGNSMFPGLSAQAARAEKAAVKASIGLPSKLQPDTVIAAKKAKERQ